MANPVNGRIFISTDIKTTSESAWKKATTELETAVKAALEGITISGVTIDAAGLALSHEISIIDAPEESDEVEETADETEESEEKPKKGKKDKAEKGSKKKGRK